MTSVQAIPPAVPASSAPTQLTPAASATSSATVKPRTQGPLERVKSVLRPGTKARELSPEDRLDKPISSPRPLAPQARLSQLLHAKQTMAQPTPTASATVPATGTATAPAAGAATATQTNKAAPKHETVPAKQLWIWLKNKVAAKPAAAPSASVSSAASTGAQGPQANATSTAPQL